MKKKKVMSEIETRKKLMNAAKMIGCEQELIQIFNKYDSLLKGCTNEKERHDISALGAVEIHKLFGAGTGTLEVNGQIVIDDLSPKIIK